MTCRRLLVTPGPRRGILPGSALVAVPPFLKLAAILLLLLGAGPLAAQPQVPRHATLVMDLANVISPEKEQHLTDALVGFRQTQQREVSVITVPDLQGYDIDAFAHQLAREWGLEDSRNDDGAALIVAPREMEVRIVAGTAVRHLLPDEVAREIVEAQVLPGLRQGDMDNGILNGAGSILIYLELTPAETAAIAEQQRLELEQARESEGFPWGGLLVLVVIVLLWPILRRAFGILGLASGAVTLLGGGGGGGGKFGGFGGGGGGFNGGGASGRW